MLEALILLMLPARKMRPRRGVQQMSLDVTEGSMSVPLDSHKQMLPGQEPGAGAAVCMVIFRLCKTCVYICAYAYVCLALLGSKTFILSCWRRAMWTVQACPLRRQGLSSQCGDSWFWNIGSTTLFWGSNVCHNTNNKRSRHYL